MKETRDQTTEKSQSETIEIKSNGENGFNIMLVFSHSQDRTLKTNINVDNVSLTEDSIKKTTTENPRRNKKKREDAADNFKKNVDRVLGNK